MIRPKPRYQGKPKVPRWPLLAGIVVFHLLALYGLSRLLAPQFTASIEEEVASVFTVTITAPEDEPPETQPEPDAGAQGDAGEEAVPQPVTAPSPSQIENQPEPRPRASSTGTATRSGATEAGDGTGNQGEGLGTGSGNEGGGQGNGIAERPSVRSGLLDPRRDFPVPAGGRSTRFGTSVTVVFTVTPDGRAQNCSVARSSADDTTTALVCGLVIEKIRFNPARRANGEPVASRYGYRVDFRER
ncbi:energy transducer TonB [uncultured Erythrobacter sp.]|uniref:energy transducer TonB n=1 Tax=uncultured Erythrobacter sp. TaxID=263913 RepID=UPI0026382BE8|nr:energy transducer TonB [uncultured Erythrobacter sp.]